MYELSEIFKIYLTCDSLRKENILQQLIDSDRKKLLPLLYLPEDSEERFRVYDLLVRIQPDGSDLLKHVFEECQGPDVLTQLAAIQFVDDNNLNDIDTFIKLFNDNIDNELVLPSIAQTISSMICKQEDPMKYKDIIKVIIEKASTDMPDLLGSLPKLVNNDDFAQMMLNSDSFKLWLIDYPYKPEMRTFNIYMRNLLAPHTKDPSSLLLSETNLMNAIIHPNVGLRCAAFEHIAAMAPHFRVQLLGFKRFQERLFDISMDSTQDEMFARKKAINALGLDKPMQDKNSPFKQQVEDLGPDLLVI